MADDFSGEENRFEEQDVSPIDQNRSSNTTTMSWIRYYFGFWVNMVRCKAFVNIATENWERKQIPSLLNNVSDKGTSVELTQSCSDVQMN